jgi:hypothetical protein
MKRIMLLLMMLIVPSVYAVTFDFQLDEGNYLRENNPTQNRGTDAIGFTGDASPSGADRGLILQTTQVISSNVTGTVTQCSLILYRVAGGVGSPSLTDLEVYGLNRSWGELTSDWTTYDGTNDWLSAGIAGGADIGSQLVIDHQGTYSDGNPINLTLDTSFCQSLIDASTVYDEGFFVTDPVARSAGDTTTGWSLDDETTDAQRPYLRIETGVAGFLQPSISITHPENNRLYAQDPLQINFTYSIDPALEVSDISLFINGTLNISSLTNTTIAIGEGDFNAVMQITDNSSQSQNSSQVSFKIDRTTPFDDLLFVFPDGFIADQNITVTAQNSNLFGHNVTVYDLSGNILFSEEQLNISAPTNQITVPVMASWGAGTFIVNSSESDDHTAKEIPDWAHASSVALRKIAYDTGQDSVTIKLEEAVRSNGIAEVDMTHQLTSITSRKAVDRYHFGFTLPEVAGWSYHYTLVLTTSRPIYLRDSSYSGHIVTGGSWVDFEPYDVTVEIIDSYTALIRLSSGNEVMFDSIGGVNVGSSQKQFQILLPSVASVTCDFGAGFSACNPTAQNLLQSRVTCQNATSAYISVTEDSTVLHNATAVQSGNDFTLNHADVPLVSNYIVEGTCVNDIGNAGVSESFSALTDDENVLTQLATGTAGVAITIVILYGIILSFRRKKR